EERNPKTMDLDLLDTIELVKKVQKEDFEIARMVEQVVPDIARAVELTAEKLKAGGRLVYFGAGTSGRLGVLDACECPPTFGVSAGLVQACIAGGKEAMFRAFEGAEDSRDFGINDVLSCNVTAKDVVVGITASGRTPYVLGAIHKAKELGATAIGVVNNT